MIKKTVGRPKEEEKERITVPKTRAEFLKLLSILSKDTFDKTKKFIYESEEKDVFERIKEVFDEAKTRGFDGKVIKKIIKIRKKNWLKEEYLLANYKEALGIVKLEASLTKDKGE